MFKSQLQEYAQKAGLPVPLVYDVTKEGPSHGPQFKASVTIRGQRYESPAFFRNLKTAEHAAAEVALAALRKAERGQLHESGLLKNLLQEYAQKCTLPLPFYSVVKTGDVHSPLYTATVEIAGMYYDGGKCKTKKESEIRAAQNALVSIYADSNAPFLYGEKDQPVDEKPASTVAEAMAEPKATMDEEPAWTSAKRRVEPKSAVEEASTSTAAVSLPQPNPTKKHRKLFKGGKEVRKKASAKKAKAISTLKQANGSPSKGSEAALTSECLKEESTEQDRLALPT